MDGQRETLPSSFIFLDRLPQTGDSRLKTKSADREKKRGNCPFFSGFERFSKGEICSNPNLHQLHTNTTAEKSKYPFCFFSINLYRIFADEIVSKNFTQIVIDFFISIVYDMIAKFGDPKCLG